MSEDCIDFLKLTETWLTLCDGACTSECCPPDLLFGTAVRALGRLGVALGLSHDAP